MTSDSAENVRQLKTRRHNINSVLFTMNSINNFYKSATAICYNTAGMSTTVSYFCHSNHVFFVFLPVIITGQNTSQTTHTNNLELS